MSKVDFFIFMTDAEVLLEQMNKAVVVDAHVALSLLNESMCLQEKLVILSKCLVYGWQIPKDLKDFSHNLNTNNIYSDNVFTAPKGHHVIT